MSNFGIRGTPRTPSHRIHDRQDVEVESAVEPCGSGLLIKQDSGHRRPAYTQDLSVKTIANWARGIFSLRTV